MLMPDGYGKELYLKESSVFVKIDKIIQYELRVGFFHIKI